MFFIRNLFPLPRLFHQLQQMRYHVKDAFRWASHSHRNLIPVRLARRILLPSRTFLACLLTCIVGAICYLSLHEPDALYSNNYARKEILQHQLDPEMNVNHFQLPEKKLPSTESRCFYEVRLAYIISLSIETSIIINCEPATKINQMSFIV